jgi:signal transduction histidine kinase
MKWTYRHRLTASFCIILAGFTLGVAAFEQYREKKYKTEALEEKLDACADFAGRYLSRHSHPSPPAFDSLLPLLPPAMRVTLIDRHGQVLYDNLLPPAAPLENHALRPEIRQAAQAGKGSDVRVSASNNRKYLYYAKLFDEYYIRMALPYDIHVRPFLKPDNGFLYYVLVLFVAGILFIRYVAGRFGKSIRQLRDFSLSAGAAGSNLAGMRFPNDELGEIGAKIVQNYAQLKANEERIELEKGKTRQLKQELTGNVAHELRTPVTSIRGYLETILEQQLEPEKERQFLQKAYRQTLTLSELISDMSLLTKLESTSGVFHLQPVELAAVIQKATADLAPALKAQGIVVTAEVPHDTLVQGNENLLYAVFRNLMENVVHHAGKDVQIIITQYGEDRGFFHFSFADTGVGIADERHLHRLFERFYRVTEGRTRDTGGTGLGLAIVKNSIAFHQGTITVQNRSGGGLQFLFSLPVGS